MKKIVSLLLASAMVLMLVMSFSLNAMAADGPTMSVVLTEASETFPAVGSTFKIVVSYSGLDVGFDNDSDYSGNELTALSYNLLIPEGITLASGRGTTSDDLKAATMATGTANIDGNTAIYGWTMTPNKDDEATRSVTSCGIYTYKFTVAEELTESVEFTLVPAADVTVIKTTKFDADGNKAGEAVYTYGNEETPLYIVNNAKIVIEQPEDPTPSTPEVATSEAVLTTPKEAMVEHGQAVAMTFAAEDLKGFAGMNWQLNFADATTKYAKVDYPATTIAALAEGTPVQFVAAFRVKANGGVENAITSIAAGFCDANKELAGITATVNAKEAAKAE